MSWDPELYLRFGHERARPFFELLQAATEAHHPQRILDLGCGPGHLTAAMAHRWPDATLVGIDSSPEMIGKAQAHTSSRVHFSVEDLRVYEPETPPNLIISNAVLQWLPDHPALLAQITGWLPEGGIFALQVPGNFEAPAAQLMREVASEAPFAKWITELRPTGIETPERYFELLSALGLETRVWETTYYQCLSGDDAVFHWTASTAQRPFIAALKAGGDALVARFQDRYAACLREAYPKTRFGTLFPFRRVFAVAHRRD